VSNPSPPERLLTLKQIAEQLQVSTKTVRRLIAVHDIPIVWVGGQIRVPTSLLALFVKKKW
jgi:excisionase family DNA binding protein